MKRDNANMVQVTVYMKQIGRHGYKNREHTDDDTFRLVLRKVRSFKLAIFVKPVIEPETETGKFLWRGLIPGTDRWFNEVHTPFIVRVAKIAQAENVEMLSIGSEYVKTLRNTAKWVETVRLVRGIYKGKLTYISNHDVSEYYSACLSEKLLNFVIWLQLKHSELRCLKNANTSVSCFFQTVVFSHIATSCFMINWILYHSPHISGYVKRGKDHIQI